MGKKRKLQGEEVAFISQHERGHSKDVRQIRTAQGGARLRQYRTSSPVFCRRE